jgi:uncharacterized protein YegJ (DUF2314 family)
MRQWAKGVLLVSLLLAPIPAAAADPEITISSADDPKMNAAKRKGLATLPYFLERMASPGPDEYGFMIKFNLGTEDDAEFIWASELVYEAGMLTGALANDPIDPRFNKGQRVTIAQPTVVDWSYTRGGIVQGNFTTRVQLELMPPEQAAELRKALGW